MLIIDIPDQASSSQRVNLSNNLVTLVFNFNVRDESWYVDVYDDTRTNAIVLGIKVVPNQTLTGNYLLSELSGGELWCIRFRNTSEPIDRNNFGSDRDYRLVWMTDQELARARN